MHRIGCQVGLPIRRQGTLNRQSLLFRYYGMGPARSLRPRAEWATPCRVNYPSVRWYWTLWGPVPERYWFPHCSFTWQRVFPWLNHIHIISESGRAKSGTRRWLSVSLKGKPEKGTLIWPQNWSLCFHPFVSSWKRSAEIHFIKKDGPLNGLHLASQLIQENPKQVWLMTPILS